ncbi:MAG TPA: hypothetical protein VNS19_15475 [Acidimicrobiales bacterium]|nr:hypothetical protein [Acidimicrobiales bacterium]
MGAGSAADGTSPPFDDAPDGFFAPEAGRDEAEFWTEADAARHASKGRARRHRAAGASAHADRGIRHRIAAAWAAETSARRALRGKAGGDSGPPSHHKRRIAAGVVGGLALLAVAVAVTEAALNDGTTSDRAEAESSPTGSGSGSGSSDGLASTRGADTGSGEQAAVESEIVDAPSTGRPGTKRPPSKPAPTTTAPKAVTEAADPSLPTPGSSGPSPSPASPAPATPVPSTVAPTPTTAPPTPTTAAPKPPAAPTIQTFTAKAASSAGGACPPLQWAMTFTWATSHATSVTITGLLEQTLGNLPGDGSRVVCRLLPTPPLGGWTLTAAGAGGSATAKG